VSEWDQRELCSDGNCVGVLGSDGTCTTCGKRGRPAGAVPPTAADATAGQSATALRGDATDFDEDDEYYYEDDEDGGDENGDDDDDDEGDAEPDEDGVATTATTTGWTDRALCPDGGCIGVIGDAGTCKVCGRSAES
jgi:hypothetical protein